jgi:arginine N-succinyltransferase
MLLVRAIREDDLDALLGLAQQAGGGMTTLKPDRGALAERINIACASFAEKIAPTSRDYMFVLENTAAHKLVGVSAIKSAVGLDEPFYNYRLGLLVHSSKELSIMSTMDTLYLSNDLTGSAELCSLFLHPDYRSGSNGRLLSKCRMLFIAQFPQLFATRLIAEMRGYLRDDGTSPFWDHLGQHFFKMDFDRADGLSGPGHKAFIAELMPRLPVYVAYLPQEAQDVIGMTHVDTTPARRLLEQEGLHYEGYVDIFDAGPVLQTRVSELRSVRESLVALPLAAGAAPGGLPLLVSNTGLAQFRVIIADGMPDSVALDEAQRQALALAPGAPVRTMTLKPQRQVAIPL